MTKSLLSANWVKRLSLYHKIFIGFSGGLDSTVLLHNLTMYPGLKNKITAVHINHGLNPNALSWQKHCQQFCKEQDVSLVIEQVEFERHANVEERAREARYQVFANLLDAKDCLVLGHHLDDQAETVLLQLLRGAGISGLAAMEDSKKLAEGMLLRPFILLTRQTLKSYAEFYHLNWIDDESNLDLAFARNYLRHQVLPMLRQRWPRVSNNLVRTSRHCRQAQANLDDLAKIDCPILDQSFLPIAPLSTLSQARLSNVLRVWFKFNKVRSPNTLIFERLISELIQAKKDATPQVAWKDACVRRYRQTLYLLKNEPKIPLHSQPWLSFPKPLTLEGLGKLYAEQVDKGLVLPPHAQIEIQFRQGGELLNWHGQTKHLKKLFQQWNIPPWKRETVPLLYVNSQIAAVIGYAISDYFYGENQINAYQITLVSMK